MNSSQSSNSSASWGDSVGEDSTVVTKTDSSNTGDSCTWYANASCKRPRTCYDCLNVRVSSGECAVMPNGMCVNLADYSDFLQQQQQFGIYYKYYSTGQYTYCSADDSACSACASKWVSDYRSTGNVGSASFCTGLDGCVCLARCELPDWQNSVITDQCNAAGSSVSTGASTASRIGFALAVGIAFGVLLGLWGIKLLFRGRRRASEPVEVCEFRTVRRPLRGPQLQLTGWNELREKLIASEQVAVGADVAILEALERCEQSTNTEQVGDDEAVYHPVSPSELVHRPRMQS